MPVPYDHILHMTSRECYTLAGFSRQRWFALIAAGAAPRPIEGVMWPAMVWSRREVERWVRDRPEQIARNHAEARKAAPVRALKNRAVLRKLTL